MTGALLFLVTAGFHVPLRIMFAGAVPDAKDDRGLLRGKGAHPFALFEFWVALYTSPPGARRLTNGCSGLGSL